jgi:hypothetical protein
MNQHTTEASVCQQEISIGLQSVEGGTEIYGNKIPACYISCEFHKLGFIGTFYALCASYRKLVACGGRKLSL